MMHIFSHGINFFLLKNMQGILKNWLKFYLVTFKKTTQFLCILVFQKTEHAFTHKQTSCAQAKIQNPTMQRKSGGPGFVACKALNSADSDLSACR